MIYTGKNGIGFTKKWQVNFTNSQKKLSNTELNMKF